jgi:adenylate cyclase
VAYESQLKSTRLQLHRRVAAAIEERAPASADANAALIAEHLQSAGDLHSAYDWHMRAGGWLIYRDIAAARTSWSRACEVADGLPADDPDRLPMRIAPRTLLCGSTFRVGAGVTNTGFDELRDLCELSGDKVSLAVGMCGLLMVQMFTGRYDDLPRLTTEYVELVESIGDPELTVGLLFAACTGKFELCHEASEGLRLAERMVELADGDPTMGNMLLGSPLAFGLCVRGVYRCYLAHPGWRADFDDAITIARPVDPNTFLMVVFLKYAQIGHHVFVSDDDALRDSAEVLEIAERIGDEFMLGIARLTRALVLIHHDAADSRAGWDLLHQARESSAQGRYFVSGVDMADLEIANRMIRDGDLDGAIDLANAMCEKLFNRGTLLWAGGTTAALVEALLRRGAAGDEDKARDAIQRLVDATQGCSLTFHDVALLRMRALMARAEGDLPAYREAAQRYGERAGELGFDGHIAIAEAMLTVV